MVMRGLGSRGNYSSGASALIQRNTSSRSAGAEALIQRAEQGRKVDFEKANAENMRRLKVKTNRKLIALKDVTKRMKNPDGSNAKYGRYKANDGQFKSTRGIVNILKAVETASGHNPSDPFSLPNKFMRLSAKKQALFISWFENMYSTFDWDIAFNTHPSDMTGESPKHWNDIRNELLELWRTVYYEKDL